MKLYEVKSTFVPPGEATPKVHTQYFALQALDPSFQGDPFQEIAQFCGGYARTGGERLLSITEFVDFKIIYTPGERT